MTNFRVMLKHLLSVGSITLLISSQGATLASTIRIQKTAQNYSQTKGARKLTPKQLKGQQKIDKKLKTKKAGIVKIKRMPPAKLKKLAKPPKSSKRVTLKTKSLKTYTNLPYYYISPDVVRRLRYIERRAIQGKPLAREKDIGNMTCTYTPTAQSAPNLQQNAISLAAQNKWGGALVQAQNQQGGRSTSGNFTQYSLPTGLTRQVYSLGVNQAALSEQIVAPARRIGYDRALRRMTSGNTIQDVGSQVNFYSAKSNSVESVLAKAGINGSGMNWSAAFRGETESNSKKNTLMIMFIQKPFTTAVDYGPNSPAEGLLGAETTNRLPNGWQENAAYISSITYGKILLMKMESVDTLEAMEAAIDASYQGLTSQGSGNFSGKTRETLSKAKFSVWSLGGNNQSILNTIASWSRGDASASLDNYFSTSNESLNLYPAISYNLRFLSDGRSVSNSTVIVEDQEVCRQNSTAMHLSLTYTHIETEDNLGADEMSFRTFTIDGRNANDPATNEIWNVGNRNMNDGDSVTLYQDTCVEVPNEGTNKFLDLSTTFYDRDTGFMESDDRVWGNYTDTIDLSDLARTLRRSNRPFNATVREGGEDGARGRLTVRVSPNARGCD